MRTSLLRPALIPMLAAAALSAAALTGAAPALGAPPALTPATGTSQPGARPLPPLARAAAANAPQPLSPAQIRSAYSLPATGARGQTIAVISAYDDPSAQADLTAYDKRFGLPPCTGANGCFRKLNQNGAASPLPFADPSGGQFITESALGVEAARGTCRSCSILLVETNSPSKADIVVAMNAAAAAGATVIVTAITPSEDGSDSFYASKLSAPHAAIVAAAGDGLAIGEGYGAPDFPASLPNVLAVGGTTLTLNRHGGYGRESVWSPTVSGCSLFQKAPPWQAADAVKVACGSARAVADLSAMADPGVLVHITGAGTPGGPWYVATGTSLAAPIIAGVIGLAGSVGSGEAQMLYQRARTEPSGFHDIRLGMNTTSCLNPICKAAPGYDGPSGLGTPDGLGAFLANGGVIDSRHPRLSVSLAGRRPNVNHNFSTPATIRNQNPFAVNGTVRLVRTLRVGGHLRNIEFARVNFRVGPLGSATVRTVIAGAQRALLQRLHAVVVYAHVKLSGPAGPSASFSGRAGSLSVA